MIDWSNDGSWMSGWSMAFMIILWLALIAVAVLVVMRTTRGNQVTPSPESRGGATPRQILDRRFATGELSATEYSAACDLLERRAGGAD